MMLWVLLALLFGVAQANMCPPTTKSPEGAITMPPSLSGKRNVYIASLFGLHDMGAGMSCGTMQTTGVQNLMAFMYGIENAKNKVQDVNTNFGLGGIVFDTCKSTGRVLQNVMNFETCTLGYGDPSVLPAEVMGYIGPETIWAYDVAKVTAAFNKTQIVFSSTHPMYSDKEKYPYLVRTVPSDVPHVDAIVSVLTSMKFKTAQFVYVDSNMGRSARQLFEAATTNAGICVEQYINVPEDAMEADAYEKAVNKLSEHPTVKAVVLWFDKPLNDQSTSQAHAFLTAVVNRNAQGMFFWVATDAWGQRLNPNYNSNSPEVAVIVSPTSSDSSSDFATYFRNLKPENKPDVFREWWMDKFDCDLPGHNKHTKVCDTPNQSLEDEVINPRAAFIVDAVYAIADAVRLTNDKKCFQKEAICDDFLQSADHRFIIKDNILKSMQGNLLDPKTGDRRQSDFEILNLRRPSGNEPKNHYIKVGTFTQLDENEPQMVLDAENIYLYDVRGVRVSSPQSTCPAGSCGKCAAPTAPPAVVTTQSPVATTPKPTEPRIMPYRMVRMKTWMVPLMVLASLGIFITICFEIYLLSKLMGTETIKHFRTMWLGQLLLIGIFLSYLLLFAFVPSPTPVTCGLIRFGVGSCYAIMFSVLLVKLMIILSSESIGYLKGVYQVLMFLFAWAVQVVIDAEWLFLVPPTASWSETNMEWQCNDSYLGHIQSLVYVMFLILICTIIAARTHGIITNHREGIFIGLASGFSIPIWIAWTLVGSLNEDMSYQEPTIAYGLLINTTLILFTMFLPKVRQLNSMGMEGIYLEDDGHDNDAYGSVIYGPPSYQSRPASMYQVNGGPLIAKDVGGNPMQLIPQQQMLYDQVQQPTYIRNGAASVRSVPAYRNSKTLKVTGDLTGRLPFDKRAVSEYGGYRPKAQSAYIGSLKRSGSVTDLGAL